MDAPETKTCRGCKRDLPLAEFKVVKANNGSGKTWLSGFCRRCINRKNKARERGHEPLPLDAEMPEDAECSTCGSIEDLVLDHCHTDGTFRGVLCRSCNLSLGYAKDNPDLLRRLATYIEP